MTTVSRRAASIGPTPVRGALPGILAGPIIPTMLRLALPTIIVLVVQTLVGVAETYFISFLGTDALAGVTLVFPILMLMQMMANGGIGGGVSSAVARAIGAGRNADADGMVWHAIVLACALGLLFTAAAILCSPILYRSMGGAGPTLTAALIYSGVVFAGSIPIWITALLSSALRGAGNVTVPALVVLSSAAILLPLSPVLIFGWGPFPRLGVAGGGAAVVIYYVVATLTFIFYLRSPRSPLRLKITPLRGHLFKEILGVGFLSAVGAVQVNLTVIFVTAAVGHFGADAIAGYGIASRLDYIQIPLLFGLGTAVVTMVGINIGAGQIVRARHIAWIGAILAFGVTELIGLAALVFPHIWIGLFSDDPQVLAMGTTYLRNVAPVYGAVGLGLVLYFASQGAKHVLLPVLAGTARMIIAAFLGWSAVNWFGSSLSVLFHIVALAAVVYGALTAAAVLNSWGRRSANKPLAQTGFTPDGEDGAVGHLPEAEDQ
ncbi:MATE family efflux transporter [Breoghania sp. JC706]|uniref:MATE family efflux transporter n=1 Tax=Breoghania sp. JC706 TaxID=3117732 RepID=UPI00300B09FF